MLVKFIYTRGCDVQSERPEDLMPQYHKNKPAASLLYLYTGWMLSVNEKTHHPLNIIFWENFESMLSPVEDFSFL